MPKTFSYMQMIYIDSDGNARHTGAAAAMETNAATRKAFNSLRTVAVSPAEATFLCDYYDRNGDLVETMGIRREDFSGITGERVKSDAEYRGIDKQYWLKARKQYLAKSAA